MIRRLSALLPAIAILILIPIASAGTVHAAGTTGVVGGNALKISPVRTDLTIEPGTTKTVDVDIQNLTSTTANLESIVDDFTASTDESGTPNILLNGQEAPTHSLKQFVAPLSNFSLAPNAEKDVVVTITIPKGTAGGGYYGLVRFAPTASGANGTANLSLSASVGSLILITVPGNVTEKVGLSSFDVRKNDHPGTIFTSAKGLDAVVRFQNQGNVQEEPFGNIVLKKGGKEIASYQVNNTTPRGNILPSSIRRFTIPLTHIGALGKYTVEGNFGYGTNGQLLTSSKTFYIVPIAAFVAGGVAILLIVFAIFGLPRIIRSYNKRVVAKATSRSKRR